MLIPYVQYAHEAQAAVAAVTYPHKCILGVSGITRASRYASIAGYAKHAHEEICLLVQVETLEVLEQIENIAAVDGVDGIFIGLAELAASMGYAGEPSHPKVKEAILGALQRIKACGQTSRILSLNQSFLREAAKTDVQFIVVDVDAVLLKNNAVSRLSEWKK